MASTVNQSSGARRVRPTGGIATTAADRSRDFRRARRHTLLVGALRYALPVATVAMVGYFGLTVLQRSGWGVSVPAIPVPQIIPENLTMKDPRYEGFSADGGRFEVTALNATQDLKNTDVVGLDGITGVMFDAADVRTDLKAGAGIFNSKIKKLELSKTVDIVSSSGMKAKLASATILIADGLVTSTEPVLVEMSAGTVRANEMKLRHKAREVTFVGAVETHLDNAKRPPNAAAPAKAAPASPFGASDAPIDIASNRLDINDNTKLAVFTGSVRAVQAGASLTSPELQVTYAGDAAGLPAGGKQKAPPADPAAAPAGQVKRIVASGPVEMTQASGDRATSKSANFDAENGKAFLDGDVVMTKAPDRRAVANRAELDQRAETVLLVGNVVVSQGRNELKGQRLLSDRKAGRTRVTSPKEDGGDGRIAARFYRNAPPAGDAAKAAAPAPATGGFGAATFKTDPTAPVDINSDSLDIFDQRKAAVFAGDVLAVQGGFRIRTAEMTAYYTGEAGLGTGATAAKDAGAKGGAELQRIEARKAVVVQSQDGQTATGDWANFDTKRNLVVVGGDVVLTQGPNVIRGSRLNIDMTTGKSTIETEPSSGWSARAQPAGDGATGSRAAIDVAPAGQNARPNTRPSAVFYPKSLKDKAAESKAAKATGAGTTEAGTADARNAGAQNAGAKSAETWGSVTRQAPVGGN